MSVELFLDSIRSLETKRVYSTYLKTCADNYDLTKTDPKVIEGMIISFIIQLKKEKSYPTPIFKLISIHLATLDCLSDRSQLFYLIDNNSISYKLKIDSYIFPLIAVLIILF